MYFFLSVPMCQYRIIKKLKLCCHLDGISVISYSAESKHIWFLAIFGSEALL